MNTPPQRLEKVITEGKTFQDGIFRGHTVATLKSVNEEDKYFTADLVWAGVFYQNVLISYDELEHLRKSGN